MVFILKHASVDQLSANVQVATIVFEIYWTTRGGALDPSFFYCYQS